MSEDEIDGPELEYHDDNTICDCFDFCSECGEHYLDCECLDD
jgi:hypothetical protein